MADHSHDTSPDPTVLSGIGTIGADIEALSERVKGALDARTLDLPTGARQPTAAITAKKHSSR